MLGKDTYRNLLLPQIACGNSELRDILAEKFDFLYLKNKSAICDDRYVYVKLQLDLIQLAMMSVRKKTDFLKRIEDAKSDRYYNAGGFMDSTSSRKAEGHSVAFSRARSNQSFDRFSESHDKARSDSKAEHHGITESKGYDLSRSEGTGTTVSKFEASGSSAGTGRGSSCSASKSESESQTTTGSMQPFSEPPSAPDLPVNVPKISCNFHQGLVTLFDLPNFTRVTDAIGSLAGSWNTANAMQEVVKLFLKTDCQNLDLVARDLNNRMQISSVDPANTTDVQLKNMIPNLGGIHRAGYRTSWGAAQFPEIYTNLNDTIAGYSAEALTRSPLSESCNRAYITPSSGRSWQLSYRFGVSFGFTIATIGVNVQLRTQISMGNSYKETEICSTGSSKRFSDSSTSSFYKDASQQTSQGHSNTTERSSNIHDAERTGMSKRDAYSKHSSCSFSTMDSRGQSHTDSARRAHSDSTAFGSAVARKEGHSHGEGKALSRSEAILEARTLSQIFTNLSAMYKRILQEWDDVIEHQVGNAGYSADQMDTPDWCAPSCAVVYGY